MCNVYHNINCSIGGQVLGEMVRGDLSSGSNSNEAKQPETKMHYCKTFLIWISSVKPMASS